MTPTQAAFRDRLVGLDPDAFAAFVAALYDARGRETARDGDDVLIRSPGGTEWERLAVRPDAADVEHPTDADRVVVPTLAPAETDPRVVDAADLREMALYAVAPEDRDALFRRFFDGFPDASDGAAPSTASPESDPHASPESDSHASSVPDPHASPESDLDPSPDRDTAPPATATTDAGADAPVDAGGEDGAARSDAGSGGPSPGDENGDASSGDDGTGRVRTLSIAATALLVVAAVALAGGPFADGNGGSDAAAATNTPGGTAVDALSPSGTATPGDAPAAADGAAVAGPFPPGVDADGIRNASALAAAHRAALSGESYHLSVVAREFVGGRPVAVARERTAVAAPTRYRSTVSVIGTFRQRPRAVADATVYADGRERFVRLTDETDADGTIRFTDRGSADGSAGGSGWRSVGVDAGADPVANRTASSLRRLIDVEQSTIVGGFERDGTRYYWIELEGRPPAGTDTVGSVLVDERGVVHEFRHEYAYVPADASTVRTVVTVQVTPGNVTVSPPPWR